VERRGFRIGAWEGFVLTGMALGGVVGEEDFDHWVALLLLDGDWVVCCLLLRCTLVQTVCAPPFIFHGG